VKKKGFLELLNHSKDAIPARDQARWKINLRLNRLGWRWTGATVRIGLIKEIAMTTHCSPLFKILSLF